MVKRRDADSYIGVATIVMAALSLTLLVLTSAESFAVILFICIVSALAGVKIADMLIGYPHEG